MALFEEKYHIRAVIPENTQNIFYAVTDILREIGVERLSDRRGYPTRQYLSFLKKGKQTKHKMLPNSGLGGRQYHTVVDEVGVVEILEKADRTDILKKEIKEKYNLKR